MANLTAEEEQGVRELLDKGVHPSSPKQFTKAEADALKQLVEVKDQLIELATAPSRDEADAATRRASEAASNEAAQADKGGGPRASDR